MIFPCTCMIHLSDQLQVREVLSAPDAPWQRTIPHFEVAAGRFPTFLIFGTIPHFAHFHPIFPHFEVGHRPADDAWYLVSIDAGTMPHFARGWFPTWQVWTDNSPLRSGELSGSKYEVGNCPAVETWKWNAEGIFGICSLVRRRLVGVGLGLWVDSSKSLARTRARRVVVSHQ